MKPWLPSSLLAFVFATAVFSTPVPAFETSAVGSALLTGDNFDTVTSRGPWLVEFYSPYCHHCRHFAPTWDKVSEYVKNETQEGKGPTAGIGMAQVNCATCGDLCSAQNVKGYPHIRM
jgi:thiol-disulfide isomerase/thioredoxin